MSHTILVVDDDPITQRVLQHYLTRTGHYILSASNGREAIEIAKRELPQLIILDVMMPEMGGLTALRHLKEMDATKSIPVIIVTVQAAPLTQLEAEASGAALFITKPFSPTQLLGGIKRLLPQPDEEAG
jgi:CheY-like chemotaxis protein